MSTGWQCPVCNRGVAPSEKSCDHGGQALLPPLPPVYIPEPYPVYPPNYWPHPWERWTCETRLADNPAITAGGVC